MTASRVYIIGISGMILLFYFAGLLTETPNSTLLDMLLAPENMPDQDEGINYQFILVLEGIATAGIALTLLITGKGDMAVKAPFALYMANLGWDIVAMFIVVNNINPIIAILVFAPIMFYYPIAIIEWWSGTG